MTTLAKVLAHWDAEAEVWVATSHDIKGLAVMAPTEEELVKKLQAVVPSLLMAGVEVIPFDMMIIDYIKAHMVAIRIPHDKGAAAAWTA